jgi:hypothetical protein
VVLCALGGELLLVRLRQFASLEDAGRDFSQSQSYKLRLRSFFWPRSQRT